MAIGTTAAILGAIGAGTNILGGVMKKRAAEGAGQIQAEQARRSGQDIVDAELATRGSIFDSANLAGTGVREAAGEANRMLDPFTGAGTDAVNLLRAGLAQGGDFNKIPTLEELQLDPGYAFRLQQGMKALEQSAAARGGATGGQALKAITGFAQGMASQEYQNAFDRFRQTTQDRFNRLSGVANKGQEASVKAGANLLGAAEYAGNTDFDANRFVANNALNAARMKAGLDTDAAAATAAGRVGGANALWGGVTGAAQTGMDTIALERLLRVNPVNKVAGGG